MSYGKVDSSNIKAALAKLESLGVTISRWNKDLASARLAQKSLDQYSQTVQLISNYIQQELAEKPKESQGTKLTGYQASLNDIKLRYSTKGLRGLIERKINEIETAQAQYAAETEKRQSQSASAQTEIKRLLPMLVSAVEAYEGARLENKDALLEAFRNQRAALNAQVDLLSDKGTYIQQISDLSRRVNQRAVVLDREEQQIKSKIQAAAKKVEVAVDKMTVNERILAIAPPPVQEAVKNLIAGLTAADVEEMLSLTSGDSSEEHSLVSVAMNQVMAVADKGGEIGKELALIARLPKAEQVKVVKALITGNGEELTDMSQGTQMALTAAVIEQLARTAKLPKKDQLAIREFSGALITNMAKIEKGEATHLSVMVEVNGHVAGFHIDLQALRANPVDLSALMSFQLLKLGVKADTPIVIAFTSLPQVGALLQLQGRSMGQLALQGRGLQELTADVLKNTSTLMQITNGDVSDVSDKSLIARTHYDASIVTSGSSFALAGKKGVESTQQTLVFDVLRALAIMQGTVTKVVLNIAAQNALGISQFIGGEPMQMLGAPMVEVPGFGLGGLGHAQLLAVAAGNSEQHLLTDGKPAVEPITIPDPIDTTIDHIETEPAVDMPVTGPTHKKEDVIVDPVAGLKPVVDKKKEEPVKPPVSPVIDATLLGHFNDAMEKLRALHTSLDEKYGKNKSKSYIVETSNALIKKLDAAAESYSQSGDSKAFKQACISAVDATVKGQYNTHRDGAVKRFFGAVAEAFSNLWSKLFASKEEHAIRKQTQAGAAGFFNAKPEDRLTKSANVLYGFNTAIEKAFSHIGVEDVGPDHGKKMGHGQ